MPPKIGQSFRTSRTLLSCVTNSRSRGSMIRQMGAAVVEELDDGHRTPWIPENWRVRVVEQIVRANGRAVGCRRICNHAGSADGGRADRSDCAQEQDSGKDAVPILADPSEQSGNHKPSTAALR